MAVWAELRCDSPAAPIEEVQRVVTMFHGAAVVCDPSDMISSLPLKVPVLTLGHLRHAHRPAAPRLIVPEEVRESSGSDPDDIGLHRRTEGCVADPR